MLNQYETVTMYTNDGSLGIYVDLNDPSAPNKGVLSSTGDHVEVPRMLIPRALAAGLRLKLTIDSTDYYLP
jgi:hypothetical protein